MKNKFLALVLATIIYWPISMYAQSVSIWDGTSEIWTQGQGTQNSPYLIENAQQLAYLAETVNGGVTHYDNTYFKLTTNVQIDSINPWQPIGLNATYYFGGHFDGDNHLVTLYMTSSTLQYFGLFGYAKNAYVENLGIGGQIRLLTNSSQQTYCGGICGYTLSTTFSNCYNTSNVFSSLSANNSHYIYTGGICGSAESTTFSNCYNAGNISSSISSSYPYSYSGGICGYAHSQTMSNCYNTGDIVSSSSSSSSSSSISGGSWAGGICGCVPSAISMISNCYNHGDVNAITQNNLSASAGGIVASYSNPESDIINSCYNTGNIISSQKAGGIIGYLEKNLHTYRQDKTATINVRNTYNTGEISGSTVGGIVGLASLHATASRAENQYGVLVIYRPTIHLNFFNSYNAGLLSSSGTRRGILAYSCIRDADFTNVNAAQYSTISVSITNCHYLNTCGGDGGGTAKTEAQMKSSSFPVILNTDSVVFVMDVTPNINQGYPVFGNVTTMDAENIASTTATLKGNFKMLYDVDTHGFEYKMSSESDYTTVHTTGEGPVSYNVSGLQGGTQYTYRFFVQKDGVTYRGADKTFNTVQCSLSGEVVASSNTLCSGDTISYSITPTSADASQYQYVWSTGATSSSIQIADDANYTVTVTDNYGCSIVRSKQMTLYPAAEASITGSTVLCNNHSTTLTANGGTYYSWNTGSAQRSITVSQPGTYIATVRTIYGCTANDTVEVVSFGNPTILGNTTFCTGNYTTLTATGGDSYLWSTGATTPSINVNAEGTYSVTATTSNGCSGSSAVNVIQNQASDVSISGNTVICSGIGTTLTASSGTSYLWSTGETTQSISANNPGNYTVTVTNNNGCSNSASQTISMMEQTSITGNTHICDGQSTTLYATGSGNYQWSNNANTSFITVTTPGNYSVTVSMPNGCSSSAAVNVTTASLLTPSILGNTVFCQGQSTMLTATGGNTYLWNNGSNSSSINISQSGIYTVTATNVEGCSASTNVTVTVNPLPNIMITGNNNFCQGSNTTLSAFGANNYIWSNGQTSNSIMVNTIGNYTVTGTDLNGCSNTTSLLVSTNPTYNIPITHSICQGESYNFLGQNLTTAGTYTQNLQTVNGCDSIITLTLIVKETPTVSISGNTSICEGQTSTLTATGGNTYIWSNGSTASSINVNQNGIYTVTATNVDGCSAITNVTVSVNPVPSITINGNTTICTGSSTTLTASGASSYLWSTGDNTASVNINTFGVYSVTGTSNEGCSSTETVTILVSQLPIITISGETDICSGESTLLTANGGDTYLWSNGSTESSISVNMAGTYQVIGYNAAGCSSMSSAEVHTWQPQSSDFTIVVDDSCYTWNNETYCASGDYTQTLQTTHGCDSIVTLHLTITVGVEDYENCAFTIFPNPTKGLVNIQFSQNMAQSADSKIQLFDIYGKLLQMIPISSKSIQIDLDSYAKGVYVVKATNNSTVYAIQKVVKQ